MSCPHGNPHEWCDICKEIDDAWNRGYACAKSEQVDLTDDEIDFLWCSNGFDPMDFARAVIEVS